MSQTPTPQSAPAPEPKSPSKIRSLARRFLPFIVLGTSFFVFFLLVSFREEVETIPPSERVWNVTAQHVQLGDIKPVLNVFGEIVAGRKVDLRTFVGGEIVEASPNLRDGGIIEADELILRVDPFNYENAVDEAIARQTEASARHEELLATRTQEENLFKRAEEQAILRKRDLDRAVKLAKAGHISQKTLDDKKLAVSQQQQSVEMRKSNLAIQEARLEQQEGAVKRSEIAVANAERNLVRTELKAPFRGFLNNVTAAEGRHLNVNDPIATLIDADQLEVRFHLSDQQFGRIVTSAGQLKGQNINILWKIGRKTLPFNGQIIRIGAEISQIAGGVSIFAAVATPNIDSTLRPGAFVQVQLADRPYENVVRLPEDVIYNGNLVYIIVDGRLEPRPVKTIGNIGGDVIIEEGLKTGDIVLTTWFAEAGPGTRVQTPATTSKKGVKRNTGQQDKNEEGT